MPFTPKQATQAHLSAMCQQCTNTIVEFKMHEEKSMRQEEAAFL